MPSGLEMPIGSPTISSEFDLVDKACVALHIDAADATGKRQDYLPSSALASDGETCEQSNVDSKAHQTESIWTCNEHVSHCTTTLHLPLRA